MPWHLLSSGLRVSRLLVRVAAFLGDYAFNFGFWEMSEIHQQPQCHSGGFEVVQNLGAMFIG